LGFVERYLEGDPRVFEFECAALFPLIAGLGAGVVWAYGHGRVSTITLVSVLGILGVWGFHSL
jgi:hypothetical protein